MHAPVPQSPGASLRIHSLKRIPYPEAWSLQRKLIDQRARGEIPDTLLLCEHDPVITVGRTPAPNDHWPDSIPGPDGPVPVHRIERGGRATFHGPGQVVAYPIIRLDRAGGGLDTHLRNLEEAVIRTCSDFSVSAIRREKCTGVWVAGGIPETSATASEFRKIASIGIAVRRWVAWHGLALNVSTDLRFFGLIRPCGFDPAVMTSLAEERGRGVSTTDVSAALAGHLQAILRA